MSERWKDRGAQDDRVGDHVMRATIGLIAERGLAGFSMDELARTARVSKASIYRRWRSRTDLVRDVTRTAMAISIDDPDTGSVRRDIESVLTSLSDVLGDPLFSAVVIEVVAEGNRDESIGSLGATLSREGRQKLMEALGRGVNRGELAPSMDLDAVAQLLAAPLFYGRYFQREPLTAEQIASLVQRVIGQLTP